MIPDKTLVLVGLGIGAAVVAVVGVAAYVNRERFDITSDRNAAYSGASGIVKAITGGAAAGGEDNVGGLFAAIREWISGDDAAIEAMKQGAPPRFPAD